MRLPVDEDRLRADIEANAEFGAITYDDPEKHGRTNRTGSDANRKARDRLVDRMEAAGLDVTVDAVGNVTGTWVADAADPNAAPVASGSHLDSVPEGGIFDGPLGVYAALESVRAIRDADVEPRRPIAVVCFTEEEGSTYGDGLVGSTAAVGERSVEETLALSDDEGETLGEALSRIGYRGEGRIDPAGWDAFYELHVEQDTALESRDADVGVVTTITGITHCEATILGEANHAGATSMADRTDALAAASELVLAVERAATEIVESASSTAVGTVGSVSVTPNATNVVPGRVDAGIDVRDVDGESIETILGTVRDCLDRLERERGVDTELERSLDVAPTPMADRLREAAHAAAADAGRTVIDIHSGAAHDAMRVARETDAALLFAPSRGGISHNPLEWTDWEDCATATEVLAGALARSSSIIQ